MPTVRIAKTWDSVPSEIRSQVYETLEEQAEHYAQRAKQLASYPEKDAQEGAEFEERLANAFRLAIEKLKGKK